MLIIDLLPSVKGFSLLKREAILLKTTKEQGFLKEQKARLIDLTDRAEEENVAPALRLFELKAEENRREVS
jgi:hypothetical protein